MDTLTIVLIVLAALTVPASLFQLAIYIQRFNAKRKKKVLNEAIKKDLGGNEEETLFHRSFDRVGIEVSKISTKLKKEEFYPDLIIGVTGETLVGGIIVGAWLASPPFLRATFYPSRSKKALDNELKAAITDPATKKILLVDDESKTGDSIWEKFTQINEIKRKDTSMRVAAIVVRKESWEKHSKIWNDPLNLSCHINRPLIEDVGWPWKV